MIPNKLLIGSLLLLSYVPIWGQEIEIKQVFVKEGKVHLIYDLFDQMDSRTYQLRLYSSKDNFISPLAKVRGDVGMEVPPGKNKEIIWNASEELGNDFRGKLSFEIRGRIYVPFVRMDQFNEYKVLKRGKSYEVNWTGGRSTNVLTFDLYKGDTKVASYPNIANAGNFNLEMPKGLKPGKKYRLQVSDKNNKDEVVVSDWFTVKRKTPFFLQALPLSLAIGLGYIAVTNLQGVNPEAPQMPGPPSPPTE
jgi:hypothetical protein